MPLKKTYEGSEHWISLFQHYSVCGWIYPIGQKKEDKTIVLKYSADGKPYVYFNISTPTIRENHQYYFFPVIAWGKLALFIHKSLELGMFVLIKGHLEEVQVNLKSWDLKTTRKRKWVHIVATSCLPFHNVVSREEADARKLKKKIYTPRPLPFEENIANAPWEGEQT